MTEAGWLKCRDPERMLRWLSGSNRPSHVPHVGTHPTYGMTVSDRKLRLVAISCCRSVWHILSGDRVRGWVELVERWAEEGGAVQECDEEFRQEVWYEGFRWIDGFRQEPDRKAKWQAAFTVLHSFPNLRQPGERRFGAKLTKAPQSAAWAIAFAAGHEVGDPGFGSVVSAELKRHVHSVRCVFHNPFRPAPVIHPAWLAWNGGTVLTLAKAVYEERELPSGHLDRVRLALLADMLEDAGCSDPNVLNHLRGPGPHVRGCWVVDLLLGKT